MQANMALAARERVHVLRYAGMLLPLLLACAVYGIFLDNPVVFDDMYFFNGIVHQEYLGRIFSFDLRWLPYATFEWTRATLGLDLIWFRLGNLSLHLANMALLYVFLQRLFGMTLADDGGETEKRRSVMAVGGAALFGLHPAAVYAVAYLTQRSTLMATFFTLVMLLLLLKGLAEKSSLLRWLSALAYLLAALSKEHAVMAPAVAAALAVLVRPAERAPVKQLLLLFVVYLLIAAYVSFKVASGAAVVGTAYQLNGSELLSRIAQADPGFDPEHAYPLSILTQAALFFKYLLVWLIPNSAWMSVDMYEPLLPRLWGLTQVIGVVAYVSFGLLAARLVWRRGMLGLIGFAMLCPWLFFFTEFSTVRVAESFVLYRSYLWMFGMTAALPWILQKLNPRQCILAIGAVVILLIPSTLLRLQTFSHSWLLWDDAVRLVEGRPVIPGAERVYYNRANAMAQFGRYAESIKDYDTAIQIHPNMAPAYGNRGVARLELSDHAGAAADFRQALILSPGSAKPHLGLARVFNEKGDLDAAAAQYAIACQLGSAMACKKVGRGQDPEK